MMNGLDGMMGPMMAWMMGYSVLIGLLVLVVLALLAVWLFQQVRLPWQSGDRKVDRD